jgi:hypothetical protein
VIVPELGPSLGRLTDPGAEPGADGAGVRLDDIRLRLVTGVFELAGAARGFAAAGDEQGAMASLSRVAWLGLWEKALASAAERIAASVNTGLDTAAEESRYPRRRLAPLRLQADDSRAIAARLGRGGAPFVAALDLLEQTARGAAANGDATHAWRDQLNAAARRLEAAWLALETAAAAEQRHWQVDVDRVRRWRRPRWPLWVLTVLVVGSAAYLGLVLGGYLPVPPALEGLAGWWWERW